MLQDLMGIQQGSLSELVKKLVEKGAVKRRDPGFVCQAAVSRE